VAGQKESTARPITPLEEEDGLWYRKGLQKARAKRAVDRKTN
jgi:hypothetical protein